MPTVTRSEMNRTADIMAERGLVRMRQSKDASPISRGTSTSGCDGKVPFLNKPAADQSARRHRGRVSYRCKHCRHWHVGNRLDK